MIWLLLACTGGTDSKGEVGELPPLLPDPAWVKDGHLAIPDDVVVSTPSPFAADRVAWRTGFSPVQTALSRIPELLPEATPGETPQKGGLIQLWDLTAGTELWMFAERDAWPDQGDDAALLVRPSEVMPVGHEIAVVIREGACAGGCSFPVEQRSDLTQTLATVRQLGVADAALAWSFPVGDGTAPLRAMDPATPTVWDLSLTDADVDPDALPAGIWRRLAGHYRTQNWLEEDVRLVPDATGLPSVVGDTEAELWIYVPESLRDAAPGTAPVLVFGHGILSNPQRYFDDGDSSGLIRLANRLNAVVVCTLWRGLTFTDNLHAVQTAGDFNKIYEVTEMLAQGVANNRALLSLVRDGGLLQDPLLEGIADPDRIYYYGISLGAIEGSVMLANEPDQNLAVLHVGGAAWTTMLERSSNWVAFEAVVANGITDPYERQRLYALSQLFWDPVDPASYVEDLKGRPLLYQQSMGDEQVPNMTTELLHRSIGTRVAAPEVRIPTDMTTVAVPSSAPLLVQLDPELGAPPPGNRPAEVTGAHGDPRMWPGVESQTVHYFTFGGEVAHFCGSAPCSASNTGE